MYATFGRPHTLLFAWLMWSTVVVAAGGATRRPPALDRRRCAARADGLRASDRAAVRADRVRRRVVYAPRVAARRSCGRRGPARSRCSSRSCRTTCRTLHVLSDRYGVGRAQASRPDVLRPAGVGGRAALRRAGPARRQLLHRARAARRGRAARAAVVPAARVLRVTVAAPVVFFSVVTDERRLGAVLRPLHDPGHARVPRRRLRRRLRDRVVGRARGGCSSPSCSLPGSPRSRFASTSQHRRAAHRIGVDAVVARGASTSRGTCCSARRGRAARTSRRSTTGTRRTSSTISSRCACRRSRASTTRRARASSRSCTGHAARATGCGCSTRRRPRRRAAAEGRSAPSRVGGHYFAVRSPAPLAPRALVREGVRLRLAWKRAVPFNRRVDELLIADRSAAGRNLRAVRRPRRSRDLAALAAGQDDTQ